MKKRIVAVLASLFLPAQAFATEGWTPLITLENFTGIKQDVLTGANGIILLILVIVGVSMLIRIFK